MIAIDNSQTGYIRTIATLMFNRLLSTHFHTLTDDEIVRIQAWILAHVSNESDSMNRMHFCDIAGHLCAYCNGNWEALFACARELTTSDQLRGTALFLWAHILPHYHLQDAPALALFLLHTSVTTISSSDVEDRKNAFFLIKVIWKLLPQDLNSQEPVNAIIAISQHFHSLIGNPSTDTNELIFCISCITRIIRSQKFAAIDALLVFTKQAGNALISDAVSLDHKVLIHEIIEASVGILDEDFQLLLQLVQATVCLSVSLCTSDRESLQYQFCLPFFHSIISSDEDSFQMFMQIISQLCSTGGLPERQVSLFILTSIIEGGVDVINENIESIISFIFACCENNPDEILISACCQTLEELIMNCSDSLTDHMDAITSFLIPKLQVIDCLHVLDVLFYQCNRPPENLPDIISGLLSLIPQSNAGQVSMVLSCITSSISRVHVRNESIFEMICPVLNHVENKGAVLECFGGLVEIAPISTKNQLPNIVEFMTATFTSEPSEGNRSAADAIFKICQILPLSLIPFLDRLVPPLIAIMQEPLTDFTVNQHFSAMQACNALIGLIPHQMSEYVPIIFQITAKSLRSDREALVIGGCSSIAYGAPGYKCLGLEMFTEIKELFDEFNDIESKDCLYAILLLIGEIFSIYPVPNEIIQTTGKLLIDSFSNCSMMKNERELDPKLQNALFFALTNFIRSKPPNEFIAPFVNASQPFVCEKIVELYARMASNELFQMTATLAQEFTDCTALRYLVMVNKEAFVGSVDSLFKISENSLPDAAAVALWATLSIEYDQLDAAKANEILGSAIPLRNSEEIAIIARLAFVFFEKNKELITPFLPQIAIRLLSSDDWVIGLCDQNVVRMMSSVFKSIGGEAVGELTEYNEGYLIRIQNHLLE